MHEILDEYRPDFSPAPWSERDRHFLEAFATNPDGIVSVLRNLPPEITGALCSRASRASASLLEVLLKEYIYPIVDGEDRRLASELEETVRFLKEHGFKHPVEHYSYEHAGHSITRPFVPTSDVREVRPHPVTKRPNMIGGTPEGQARANEDSWEKLLSFLDRYLRK